MQSRPGIRDGFDLSFFLEYGVATKAGKQFGTKPSPGVAWNVKATNA